jgi:hypothetical protein
VKAIRRIFTDDSVFEVFGGENQLFLAAAVLRRRFRPVC